MGASLMVSGDPREAVDAPTELEWRFDVPLLTSRFMLWDFVRVTLISVAIMYVLVAFMGWIVEGEVVILPPFVLLITTAVMLGLFFLASLMLGGRHGARFGVTSEGVSYAAEERERRINQAVTVLGALAGNPTTTGAGLIAQGQERLFVPWSEIERVVYYPRPRVIVIRNSWRAVLRLHCTAENYGAVANACERYWAATAPQRAKAAGEAPRRGPWWYYAALEVAVVCAAVGAQIWYWNDYELAARMGVIGAVGVALAVAFEGAPRRIFGFVALPLLVWHGGALVLSAASSTVDSYFGRVFTASFDSGELVLSLLSLAVLLGMAAWRTFGPEPATQR